MKKILILIIFLFLCVTVYSQAKFMGIPFGKTSEMIHELENKGFNTLFEYSNESAMEGFFDGEECILFIKSYKDNVYEIWVIFVKSFIYKYDAFLSFNTYSDLLNIKYLNKNNVHIPIDYSYNMKPDERYLNLFFDTNESGEICTLIMLIMTYPSSNYEYHIVITYAYSENGPKGEDL